MTDHQAFEERFNLVCERVGGVSKVAGKIGCHPNTLYRIRATNGYPSAQQLIALARSYHIDLNWLLAVDNIDNPCE